MASIIKGDLLKAKENIIVHQVNCKGVMNSGIAEQIKLKFPNVFDEYVEFIDENNGQVLGDVCFSEIEDDKYIANLFGQDDYGYSGELYTNYDAVEKALKKIASAARANDYSVAFPYRMSSDRGGADWSRIISMIRKHFLDLDYNFYKYNK